MNLYSCYITSQESQLSLTDRASATAVDASSLQITNDSFRYASLYLWNQLLSCSFSSLSSWFTSSCTYHLITVPIFTLTIYLLLQT